MQDANTIFTSLPVKHNLTLSQYPKINDNKYIKTILEIYITYS